jgi:hypothetical protein
MSEYSYSYHLYKTPAKDVVALLKRAKLDGFVLDVFGAWTPFVIPETVIERDPTAV